MSPIWDLPSPPEGVIGGAGGGGSGTTTGAAAARGLVGLFDMRFDPITGDLIDDGFGSCELTTTAETAVLLQLLCHYQEWWGDPDAGSTLHQLERFQQDPAGLIQAETRRALGVLVDAALIADLDVRAVESKAGRVDVATSFRDTKTGTPIALAVPASGV